MTTLIAFHDVDDVDHWLSSPKRAELFGAIGVSVRTFTDPAKSNRTGLILDVPDMATFDELMASETGRQAMEHDGVHPDSLVMLVES